MNKELVDDNCIHAISIFSFSTVLRNAAITAFSAKKKSVRHSAKF